MLSRSDVHAAGFARMHPFELMCTTCAVQPAPHGYLPCPVWAYAQQQWPYYDMPTQPRRAFLLACQGSRYDWLTHTAVVVLLVCTQQVLDAGAHLKANILR